MNSATISKETKPSGHFSRAIWLKRVRQLHLYLGTFFAPSIMFFALSGALQLFGLHEGHPGETYQPPAWVAKLGSIHKNQTLAERPGPPPEFRKESRPPKVEERHRNGPHQTSKSTFALKWFFLAMSVGLIFTTCLGIYMAFKFNRSRSIWTTLLLGTALPAALIAMTA